MNASGPLRRPSGVWPACGPNTCPVYALSWTRFGHMSTAWTCPGRQRSDVGIAASLEEVEHGG